MFLSVVCVYRPTEPLCDAIPRSANHIQGVCREFGSRLDFHFRSILAKSGYPGRNFIYRMSARISPIKINPRDEIGWT